MITGVNRVSFVRVPQHRNDPWSAARRAACSLRQKAEAGDQFGGVDTILVQYHPISIQQRLWSCIDVMPHVWMLQA